MFDLKIQTTQKPTLDPTASGEIHSGFDLMDRPGIFHRAGVLFRQWELRLFNAMSQLKHDTDNHARKPDYQNVEQEHYPEGMDQERQSKSQCHDQHFTANKPDEFPPFRPGHSRRSDPAKDYVTEIVIEMPLDHIQSVERPQIKMLPAMESESLLMWR
jgi:hypothetical protein